MIFLAKTEKPRLPLFVLRCPVRRRKKNAQLLKEMEARGEAFQITEVASPISLGSTSQRERSAFLGKLQHRAQKASTKTQAAVKVALRKTAGGVRAAKNVAQTAARSARDWMENRNRG